MPTSSQERDDARLPPPLDWESFYRNYRSPGYVPGYELLHKLGGGFFGIVFKARKVSIDKPYAIKFLKVDDPSAREQVVKELEAVKLFAQIDHPNLVSIEDKGVVDGIPYIVMGYAGEETLKSRFDEGPLTEEETLSYFVQILRGVQALHHHSLVHFDLKPANVFLKGDVARVGDYGLSKLVSQSCLSLTTGRGTPYYMAPEMLNRKGDHRSDIYSLGVILYECLAADVPFRGENEWEVLKGHQEGEVVYPDAIGPSYRGHLSRMLAKQPEERFQSIDEILQDLRAPGPLGESVRFDLGPSRRPRESVKAAPKEVEPTVRAADATAARVRQAWHMPHERRTARRHELQASRWHASWWQVVFFLMFMLVLFGLLFYLTMPLSEFSATAESREDRIGRPRPSVVEVTDSLPAPGDVVQSHGITVGLVGVVVGLFFLSLVVGVTILVFRGGRRAAHRSRGPPFTRC